MELFSSILPKIFYLLLLFSAGIFLKKFKLISDKTEEELSRLFTDFFWPCLILYSITAKLDRSDIFNNWALPVLGAVTVFAGLAVGLIAVMITRMKGDEKKIFLFHSSFNNFSFMVLPLATLFLPEKGAGLLFINNLAFILLIWTLGILLLTGRGQIREIPKKLLNPSLIAAVVGIILVIAGLTRFIPKIANDLLETFGTPTIPIAMIVIGARIYKMGFGSLKFNSWNILLGVVRLIIIPGVLFLLTFWLKDLLHLTREMIIIFTLVNVMPVSVNSVSMSINYQSSPDLAAQGVVFTHLFSIITIVVFVSLMSVFLLSP